MKHQSGHVFKIEPSAEQSALMAQFCGMARYVYNRALAQQNEQYDLVGKVDSAYVIKKQLPLWKREEATRWLADAPSQGLQSAMLNLANAWKRYFDPKLPNAEKPTFKKSRKYCAYTFPQGFDLDQGNSRVWLPKLGWMPYRNSRKGDKNLHGEFRSITIRRTCGVWYITVSVRQNRVKPTERRQKWIGVDVGIACHAAQSNGDMLASPKSLRRAAKRVSRMQAFRDKNMKKGSKSFAKESLKIVKLQARIANIRKDHLHKFTTKLVKNQDVVVVEDLKVKNMSKSAKGTKENPGVNVAAKRGLNRQILAQGWFEMRRQLTYKAEWSGGLVIAVDPRHTSQRCHVCEAVDRKNRVSQSRFVCTSCGLEFHADTNAAKNILAAGIAVTALGALGSSQAVKSEPLIEV